MLIEIFEKGIRIVIVDGFTRHHSGKRVWLVCDLRETFKLFGIHAVGKRIVDHSDIAITMEEWTTYLKKLFIVW